MPNHPLSNTPELGGIQFDCAFGLDLCGYSRRAGFAIAIRGSSGRIHVTLFRNHPFSGHFESKKINRARIGDVNRVEEAFLVSTKELGIPLFVDVPIDLQNLDRLWTRVIKTNWQLCYRPVDYVLAAMPPIASHIGRVTVRFAHTYGRKLGTDNYNNYPLIGYHIFETYPKEVLRLAYRKLGKCGLQSQMNAESNVKPWVGYKKGLAKWFGKEWAAVNTSNSNHIHVARLANDLRLIGDRTFTLSDDDLDAIVCAVTGISASNQKDIENRIVSTLTDQESEDIVSDYERLVPRGYHLTNDWDPFPIGVTMVDDYFEWDSKEAIMRAKIQKAIVDRKLIENLRGRTASAVERRFRS